MQVYMINKYRLEGAFYQENGLEVKTVSFKAEKKNHFSYLVSVADDGNFSCHCAAENRHNLHLPVRSAEGYVLRALEWQ